MSPEDIEHRFAYHAPGPLKVEVHGDIRQVGWTIADYFNSVLPEGREKALALTKIEEAVMWANAAVARGELK